MRTTWVKDAGRGEVLMPFVVEKLRTKWVLANSWMTTSSSFKISMYKSFGKSLGALTTKHFVG